MRKKILSIIWGFILILPYSFVSSAFSSDDYVNRNFYYINHYEGVAYNLVFDDNGGINAYGLDGTQENAFYGYEINNDFMFLCDVPDEHSAYVYIEEENSFIPQYDSYSVCGIFGFPNCIIHYDNTPTQSQIAEDNIRLKKQHIFNNQPLTRNQAYEAVYNYLYSNFNLYSTDHTYFDISQSNDNYVDGMYQIYYRSYTGAESYYKVNPVTGQVICETLSVPVIDVAPEEYDAGFNAYDFTRGTGENSFSLNNASELLSGLWGAASMGESYPYGEHNNSYYVIFNGEKATYYNSTENGLIKLEEHIITYLEKDDEENVYRIFLDNGVCFESNEINDNNDISVLSYYTVASGWGWMESEYLGSDSIYKIADDIPDINSEMDESGSEENLDENNDSITADIKHIDGSCTVKLSSEMFERNSSEGYMDTALLSVVLSKAAYDGWFGVKDGRYIVGAYKDLGFKDEDICLYSYPDSNYNDSKYIFNDSTYAFSIANRKLGDKTLLVIDFRGTKSIGDIFKDAKYWKGHVWDELFINEHIWGGFYDFVDDCNIAIKEYYDNHPSVKIADEDGSLVVLVTGHSLGAAAANITGRNLNEGKSVFQNLKSENIYVYTFACPKVSNDVKKYKNIINFVNRNDLVPFVPPFLKRNGRDIYFTTNTIKGNHDCTTYINAVKTDIMIADIKNSASEVSKFVGVMCPVDIEIIKNNDVVGKVEDNEILICEDDICIEIEDDHKYILLPDDEDYKININATHNGKMSFYLLGCNEENEYVKTYSDIEILEGESFVAEITNGDNSKNTELQYVSDNKNIDIPEDTDSQTSGEQFTEIKNKFEKESVKYWIIGISTSFIVLLFLVFILIRKSKKKEKTEIVNKDIFTFHNNNEIKNDNVKNNYCTECGKLLSSKQRFCSACGCRNIFYNDDVN